MNDSEEQQISGNSSRVGLRSSSEVNHDLSVFASAEFRYDASERSSDQVFNDKRNTYVGIDSTYGQLKAGNFNSIYYDAVSSLFDIYHNYGYIALGSVSTAANADSIAYKTPEFMNMTFSGQGRLYTSDQTVSGEEEIIFQANGTYTMENLYIGLAAIFENDEAEARFNEEEDGTVTTEPVFPGSIIGATVRYTLLENIDMRVMFEYDTDRDFNKTHAVYGLIYNYGSGSVYGSVGRNWEEEVYFGIGGGYSFSEPMSLFIEYANGDPIGAEQMFTTGFTYVF